MSSPIELYQILIERFNDSELRTLCFHLNIDYDALPGEGTHNKARELIAYLERRRSLHQLVWEINDSRRDISLADPLQPSSTVDLTGIWQCDDGAVYYIRQIGDKVFWLGEKEAEDPRFCNVAFGSVTPSDVTLQWADVPKGKNRHFGTIYLRVSDNGMRLTATKHERFGGSIWVKSDS